MSALSVASMMVCGMPNYLNGRLILSASDAVWGAVEELPDDLKPYFTDELGNESVNYGGFLQMVSVNALQFLGEAGLFACFRCVSAEYLDQVQTFPPEEKYQILMHELYPVGWDISTGNGWLSASCHGCFPINPFTGAELDAHAETINDYGLFSDLNDCLMYCKINDVEIQEHAPWFPVAIYVDQSSYDRLNAFLEESKLAQRDRPWERRAP